jgi:hypothetical protein
MNNRLLDIAIANSISQKKLTNESLSWTTLANRLSVNKITGETLQEYLSFNKDTQNKIKDIGGFVGGYLVNGDRHKGSVKHRSLITLDIDSCDIHQDNLLKLIDSNLADTTYVVYSTHKHTKNNPRVRLVIPLDRDVNMIEHEALGRLIASSINLSYFDKSTFEENRIMYYPSSTIDTKPLYLFKDGQLLDTALYLAKYEDYQDTSSWKILPNAQTRKRYEPSLEERRSSETTTINKSGYIGAFLQAYPIREALKELLSSEFEETNDDSRYTYIDGTSSKGLVLYGDYAYSYHSSDIGYGHGGLNSFDLVRIHKYGHLDQEIEYDPRDKKIITTLPSFKQMIKQIRLDPKVIRCLNQNRINEFMDSDININNRSDRMAQQETKEHTLPEYADKVKVTLKGNLGKDPEVVEDRDIPYAKIVLAINQATKNSPELGPEWHELVFFGQNSVNQVKSVHKGDLVKIGGILKTKEYEIHSQDGVKLQAPIKYKGYAIYGNTIEKVNTSKSDKVANEEAVL